MMLYSCLLYTSVKGRHDPCIVPRAIPVVEAALALGLLDLLESEACTLRP